eukprot:TRINITY_DN3129_c0_g1_i2.p1 TRINITY_DN3129_c0_g1~~TRINITY_DN3129_c0_g1_i2.p1  ORF type:complete len:389 (+),score=91.76 TRINITY_DN3129_c0_g1_i2:59-1168(+)
MSAEAMNVDMTGEDTKFEYKFDTLLAKENVGIRICQFLDTRDRCVFAPLSRTFSTLVTKPEVWEVADFSCFCPIFVKDDIVVNLLKRFPFIKRLNLSFCSKITNKTLQAVAASLRESLVELNLEGCGKAVGDAGLLRVALSCGSTLQRLNVSGCNLVTAAALQQVAQNATHLRFLSLCNLPSVEDNTLIHLSRSPSLEGLELDGCKFTAQGLARFASSITHRLKRLSVQYCRAVSDEALQFLSQYCVNLEELSLYGCVGVTDRGLLGLSGHCHKLRCVDLSLCIHITDAGVGRLLASSPSLTHLILYNCPNITDQTLEHVATYCPALLYLSLYGLKRVTDPAVLSLLDRLPQLYLVNRTGSFLTLPPKS